MSAALEEYLNLFGEAAGGVQARKRNYATLSLRFYDLVTGFYEFAWGQSFHFAPRMDGENLPDSLTRCQRHLADRLGLKPGMRVLDAGCGVGGPMQEIARHSGASVIGINNHAGQVRKARAHVLRAGLEGQCIPLVADFMKISFAEGVFDAAYAIESMVYAPDKGVAFAEIFRVLRPGGTFVCQEWCLTPSYDAGESRHRQLKSIIEVGNGLPELASTDAVTAALAAAGFELIEAHDRAADSDPGTPWFRALQGRDFTLVSLPRTPIGRVLTNWATRLFETVGIAPDGTTAVSTLLNDAGDALTEAGALGIFTPLFVCLARKPAAAAEQGFEAMPGTAFSRGSDG